MWVETEGKGPRNHGRLLERGVAYGGQLEEEPSLQRYHQEQQA